MAIPRSWPGGEQWQQPGLQFRHRAALPKASLGGVGAQVYSGTLTPGSNGYFLGGGGGMLDIYHVSDRANSLSVNTPSGGAVVLPSSANNYTGSTAIGPGNMLQFGGYGNLPSGSAISISAARSRLPP